MKLNKEKTNMCQKSECNKCENCPAMNWKQKLTVEDIKLELNTLCEEIREYKSQGDIDQQVLTEMELRLIDTYRHAEKLGVTYTLDELS